MEDEKEYFVVSVLFIIVESITGIHIRAYLTLITTTLFDYANEKVKDSLFLLCRVYYFASRHFVVAMQVVTTSHMEIIKNKTCCW